MKIFFVLLVLLLISLNSYSQYTWVQQQSNTGLPFYGIYFVNNMTGWLCGYEGMIKKTTNGGANWLTQQSGTSTNLYALHFVNANTGWAAGGYYEYNNWGFITIVKTTNGGANWFIQRNEPTDYNYPNHLYFFDANTGIAGCYGNNGGAITGGLLKTTNGGVNWLWVQGSKPTRKFVFLNSQTGYCISKVWSDYNNIDTGLVYKTTNGGSNWTLQLQRYKWQFRGIDFFNVNTGIVLGSPDSTGIYNRYFKTTNGGTNWVQMNWGDAAHVACFFNNEFTGWAVGSKIYRTTNSGINWSISLDNPWSSLNVITFVNSYNGWAAGTNGVIYHTIYQETSTGNYFPLQVGNVYLYRSWDFPYPQNGYYFYARILRDTIAFGKRYFYCFNIPSIQNGWVRYDSLSGLLLQLYPGNGCGNNPNDKVIDSLKAKLGNTLNYCPYNATMSRLCNDTSYVTLFNYYNTKKKGFAHDGLIVSNVIYGNNIGIFSYGSGEPPPISHYVDLVGCYVNGVMYGDTTLTGIKNISTEVPSNFSLSQNYPNPFNPTTLIRINVGKTENGKQKTVTELAVYDIAGRLIQTLVKEELQPGTYEVTFDGSALTSGVYFYQLRTDNFVQTKKLVLMK
jgi:photosystem II stability/assembly factor-like uncharacterized protein